MSSAICFNFDQSKMLSSGNGLIKFYLSNQLMTDPIYTVPSIFPVSMSCMIFHPIYIFISFLASRDWACKWLLHISIFQVLHHSVKSKQEGHDGPVSLHWLIREIHSYQTLHYLGIGLKHKTPYKD